MPTQPNNDEPGDPLAELANAFTDMARRVSAVSPDPAGDLRAVVEQARPLRQRLKRVSGDLCLELVNQLTWIVARAQAGTIVHRKRDQQQAATEVRQKATEISAILRQAQRAEAAHE